MMSLGDAARAVLEAEIAEADKRVTMGRDHIALQRRLLASLQRGGHDTALAISLLKTFLDSQTLHEADVARLRNELVRWTDFERETR